LSKELLSGNAAFARGAWEAGVTVASAYPGTPSTEILENVSKYKDDIYCEWAPNEKVALEMGVGSCLTGARTLVAMKHVGLNVAADPFMNSSQVGTEGGLVIVVADDPGMHSSQNEQDTRNYAKFAKVPILEPSDSQEAKDFVLRGMKISEKYETPVLIRSNTRISHSRTLVELEERIQLEREIGFEKNPEKYVAVPAFARKMRQNVEQRSGRLKKLANRTELNQKEIKNTERGIITNSISYQYVKEVFPDDSILKLGMSNPFPNQVIEEFADEVDELLIVEELDEVIEQQVKALGIECTGRDYVPGIGEHSPTIIENVRDQLEGASTQKEKSAPEFAQDLPGRPPNLCPGCPHRGVFYGLAQRDVIVTGDIGCYSLGAFEPLNRLDVILCMGGGISMAHGMDKSDEPKEVVGIMGDSTFFHSGITGLLDIGYNQGSSTIIVVDNRTTAMTGHQDHPGTGKTLMGEQTEQRSIKEFGEACGIERISTVRPYELEETQQVINREIDAEDPSLIISKAPCVLKTGEAVGKVRIINHDICQDCGKCLDLGCSAIEVSPGEKPTINPHLCSGCSMCEQVCPFGAISTKEETSNEQ